MTRRQRHRIFKRWSAMFGGNVSPRDVWLAGRLPWKWSTWRAAHYRRRRSFL